MSYVVASHLAGEPCEKNADVFDSPQMMRARG